MRLGHGSATPWVSRASWPGLSRPAPPRAWSAGRDACSGSRPVAPATSSTSAMAYSRAALSKTSRRSSRRFAKEYQPLPDAKTGVLCMAYGSPAGTDEDDGIEPYYTHIRGGRKPSLEALAELRERYRAIGGSLLTEITRAQARALAARLGLPVFAGMKHAPPFIADAAAEARSAGLERLVGLPLAPPYPPITLAPYFPPPRPPRGFAFQPASHTGEPWLGPDLLDSLARSGVRRALLCPIGFVADPLEILYDIDVEAMAFAREHGIDLRRTQSFNTRPEFIDALAAVVGDAPVTSSQAQSARIMTE